MKNIRKIAAVIFAFVLVFGAAFVFGASAEEFDGVIYTKKSGKYIVTGVSSAFEGELVIPAEIDGIPVEEIGERALANNTALGDVTLPASIKKVGKYAFSECPGIRKVTFAESEETVTLMEGAFSGCNNLADVTLPAHLYIIPSNCFSSCALTSVVIPEGTDTIGTKAFINSALTEVFIPASVTSIGEDAFFGCESLEGFYFQQPSVYYKQSGGVLFSAGGEDLVQYPLGRTETTYTVPSGVLYIDSGAFAFSKLKKVTISEGVEEIGVAAFSNSKVEFVSFPSTLRKISRNAFLLCKSLKSVTIPGSVTEFSDAFYGSGVETVVFENGIKTIPNDSFTNCESLKSVTIPDSVTKIASAFGGCTALEEVYIPSSVTEIAHDAFNGCENLIIKGDEGSYAIEYAVANNIPYEINQNNPDNPDNPDNPVINVVLGVPSNNKAEYRSKVTVVATAQNLPDGCRVVISGGGRNATGKERAALTIDEIKETTVFTVKVLDKNSRVLANSDGTVLQKELTVEVNSGFFAKIIAWFKALFRLLPEYTFEPKN